MKSIKVKVSKKDVVALKPHIQWYGKVAAQLEKQILILGGKPAFNKEGTLVFDGEKELRRICKKNTELMDACKYVYDSFVNDKKARSFVSTFLGGKREPSEDGKKMGRPTTKQKSEETLIAEQTLKEKLSLLEKNKILPFKLDTDGIPLVGMQKGASGYRYALVMEIYTKLASYNTQVEQVNADYKTLSDNLITFSAKFFEECPANVKDDFEAFVADCETYNHRINFKFISFLRNYLTADSTNLSAIPLVGYWTDKDENNHRYSLKPEILESLKRHSSIVIGSYPILLIEKNRENKIEKYCELVYRFRNKKEIPSYTAISAETCKCLLGNNTIGFKVSHVDNKLIWSIKSPTGNPLQFVTNYIRFGKGKHYQLENLSILPIMDKNGKSESGNYNITYSCNGKQPFKGVFKEPNIIMRGDEMFVQIPVSMDVDEKLMLLVSKIRGALNTAYPCPKRKSSKQKSIDTPEQKLPDLFKKLNRPLRVMGVDLGLRGIASVIVDFDGIVEQINNNINGLNAENIIRDDGGIFLKGDIAERMKFAAFVKKVNRTQELIDFARDIYNCKTEDEEVSIETVYNKTSNCAKADYIAWVKDKKKSGVKLHELKYRKHNWIVGELYAEIRRDIIKLKVERAYGDLTKLRDENGKKIKCGNTYDFLNLPFWANAIKRFISFSKSFCFAGMESPEKKVTGIKSLHNTEGFCQVWQDLYSNVKEDYAKKVANHIVINAKNNKVDIIAVEELSSNLGNRDKKTKNDNEMFLAWNCGRIKFHIEAMAKDYGILMTEVNEFETSQVEYNTQEYGMRDETNSEFLWYNDSDGNLKRCNADINAAKNIAKRFISQHTNMCSYPIIQIGSTDEYQLDIKEESKRVPGAAFKEFGTLDVKFPNVKFRKKNGEFHKTTRIYKIGGNWMDKSGKNVHLAMIESRIPKPK